MDAREPVWSLQLVSVSYLHVACRETALVYWSTKAAPMRDFCDTSARIYRPSFLKTSPKRSISVIENERFGLVFAKTRSINRAQGSWNFQKLAAEQPLPGKALRSVCQGM